MYRQIILDRTTPAAVLRFVRGTVDLQLNDVHAMMRLPLAGDGITAGCNFAIAAVLLNVISGTSVVLYDPGPTTRGRRGELFRGCVKDFYPWDLEPSNGVRDGKRGADVLYRLFRNPLAHSFGRHEAVPMRSIERQPGGYTEDEIEALEMAADVRPAAQLVAAPTLAERDAGKAMGLIVEPLYWGVRTMIHRLTRDVNRMAIAEALL